MYGGGHVDVVSSMEDLVEEEVIAGTYADHHEDKRIYDPPPAHGEPLSLVVDRTTSNTDGKMRTFYSDEDENYYLEPRPPRNADSAPPSFN